MPLFEITIKCYKPATCEMTRVVRAKSQRETEDKLLQGTLNGIFDDDEIDWIAADSEIIWEDAGPAEGNE